MAKAVTLFIIILTIIIVMLSGFYAGTVIEGLKTKYYKTQMTTFCQLSEEAFGEAYPNFYPCEQWYLENNYKLEDRPTAWNK